MTTRRILFVEDRPEQHLLFNQAVEEWNVASEPQKLEIAAANSVDEAKGLLETEKFDCALFDLRLPDAATGDDSSEGGNALIGLGFHRYGIPVAVMSANLNELDQAYRDAGIGVFDKGDLDAYDRAVAWFADRWDMLDVLAAAREQMEISGAEVFAGRIWPRWSRLKALKGADADQLRRIVTRQYASHIAELLGVDEGDNPGWHPFENYIYPSLFQNRPHTGDIFDLDGELWVVVTPQCDMATGKTTSILLAHCRRDAVPDWERRVAELALDGLSEKDAKRRDKFFADLINQAVPSQHFLPPIDGEGPLLVSFKELCVRQADELSARLAERRGSVAPAFLGNLAQRFGAYISRPGQPNIEARHFG